MACNIIKNPNGKVVKVTANNGKDSKLFKDIVNLGYDKETAVKKWAMVYTPTFRQWFGKGIVDSNGEPTINMVNNKPVFIGEDNSIKHATENLGSFISKKDPSALLDQIKRRFDLVKTDGTIKNIPNKYSPYDIQERIEKEYPGVKANILQDIGGDYINLMIDPHLDVDNIYHQIESNRLAEKDKEIDEAMSTFLKSIGVKVREVSQIRDKNGNPISVTAKADMVNKLVEISKDKIGIDTLPEEAAHFMVELLKVGNSPLFPAMMNNIENFSVYQEVIENPLYQKLYEGDINKLKQEAIGKLIAKHIIKNIKGNESPVHIRRIDSWWSRVLEFIKDLFTPAYQNPYSKAAHMMLNAKVNEYLDVEKVSGSMTGEYFQAETPINTKDRTIDTIRLLDQENNNWETQRVSLEKAGLKEQWFVEEGNETERYVGKENGPYAGKIIKGRVSDKVKQHFYKINRGKIRDLTGKEKQLRLDNNAVRKATGTMGHQVLQDLIELYANGKGNRNKILNNSLFTAGQFQILEQGVKDLIAQIKKQQKEINIENKKKGIPEGKVIIRTEQMITNRDQSVGGSIDLLAVFSDNSASIYDYKFISPAKNTYVDPFTNRIVEDPHAVKMQTYDIQISQYKQNLIENYGITEIKQSRIVPIHVRYKTEKGGKLTEQVSVVQMGTKYSEFLEQIPVAGEMTKFEDINKIIRKLITRKALVDRQLQTKKYKAGESFESLKAQQAKITKQLRVLQIDQDVAYVIKSLNDDIQTIQNKLGNNIPILKSGEPNPNYLTDQDLNDLLHDLIFYQSIVGLHDYVDYMENTSPEKHKEYEVLRNRLSGFLSQAITQVQGKMLERTADKAEERGIKGLKSYNLDVDWMTSNFVNLSKQTNPFLRNLWEMMDELNFTKRKIVKIKAEEIQRVQDAFVGKKGIKAFDMLLNEDGSFKSKYSADYYSQRDAAIKNNNYSWFDLKNGNVQIDEKYYKKKYKEFRAGKLKALQNKYGKNQSAINREIKKWELAHDVKNHLRTAALNKGGQYFLRPSEKWISEEYKAIQSDPAAKEFYDLYMQTIKEVEEMYGERLGPNFTAEVHKGFIESAFINGSMKEAVDSSVEAFQIREHDLSFGIRDENTGRLVKQIPKLFIQPLRDKNGNIDSSLKSRDLGKGLLLLFNSAVDHQLKTEILPEVQAMEALLATDGVEVESTDIFGNIIEESSALGKVFKERPKKLYETYQKFVDSYIYGTTLDAKDIAIGKISKRKSLLGLKNFHSITQLGFKLPVAVGAFTAGMVGLEYEASKGTFITRRNLRKAQGALMKADPKMRALVEYLDYYQKDDAQSRANRLSATYAVRHLTNDKWFAFLSTADRGIDAITLYATALNMGIDENGNVKRLSQLPEGSKNILELMELEENPLWEGTTTNVSNKAVDRYKTKIKGITDKGELKLRNIGREISFKVKGSMSDEDKAMYNTNMFMRLMMHYKSWLPGVAMARFGKQRYSQILETFDEGTWNSAFQNMEISKSFTSKEALDAEIHILNTVKTLGLDLVNMAIDIGTFGFFNRVKVKDGLARARFDTWAANNATNPEFSEKLRDREGREELYQEFIKMKQGNIKAFLMEWRMKFAFLLLLAQLGGDEDEDGKIDIRQTFLGRKFHNILNRAYREVAVFTAPGEFLQAGRATGIPLLNLGYQLGEWAENFGDEIFDEITGEEPYTNDDRKEKFYVTFKLLPGLNAFSKGVEMFPQQKYEQY